MFGKSFVNKIIELMGLSVLKLENRKMLELYLEELELYLEEYKELFDLISKAVGVEQFSNAQLKQDIFVLLETGFKRNGFFVEFGACNGIELSNTYLLEKCYDWQGILAEPVTIWHDELKKNRRAIIETDCIWNETGKSVEMVVPQDHMLSTIVEFADGDLNAESRINGLSLFVNTVSLSDLLERHNSPNVIDYLSIDTEGSEFEILNNFNFEEYNIKVITCEHNFSQKRQDIFDLLTSKGYARKFTGQSSFDDWYVKL